MDAHLWATELKIGNTIFCCVEVGERFRFNGSTEWLTKTSARGYANAAGKKFVTGNKTAVFIEALDK